MILETAMMIDRHGVEYLERQAGRTPDGAPDPRVNQMLKAIDWDPALKNANRWYDRIAAALRMQDRSAREKQLNEIHRDLSLLRAKAMDAGGLAQLLQGKEKPDKALGEAVGDVLISQLVPAFNKVQQAADRNEQAQRNLHIAFALAAYRSDHGAYPKRLGELTPTYLSHVPEDLFSGKALIYRPAEDGYLLYSVGPNGRDEGGRRYDDDPPGDDLRVRLPLPKTK
jgi:hypothetical protein